MKAYEYILGIHSKKLITLISGDLRCDWCLSRSGQNVCHMTFMWPHGSPWCVSSPLPSLRPVSWRLSGTPARCPAVQLLGSLWPHRTQPTPAWYHSWYACPTALKEWQILNRVILKPKSYKKLNHSSQQAGISTKTVNVPPRGFREFRVPKHNETGYSEVNTIIPTGLTSKTGLFWWCPILE